MVLLTLREMAKGGMHDQLGGGFHRYSVDERWFVPHFEKMLYDQAQLAISYLEAFRSPATAQYAETARGIFDYVLRDMTGSGRRFLFGGGCRQRHRPRAIRTTRARAHSMFGARTRFGTEPASPPPIGSATATASKPRQRGRRPARRIHRQEILYQAHTVEETAQQFGRPPDEVGAGLARSRAHSAAGRAPALRPHLDDKILTAWNGLMISAFARGGAILEEPRYADAARRAAEFLIARVYDPQTGALLRRYRQGEAAIPGFSGRLRAVRPRAARSVRSPVRPAGFGTRHPPHRKTDASCLKTPRKERSSPPPRTMPAWSCA